MNEEPNEQPVAGEREEDWDKPFADKIAEMDMPELRARILRQATHIEAYQQCLDGLGLCGLDGHRDPRDIRRAVEMGLGAAAAKTKKASSANRSAFDSSALLGALAEDLEREAEDCKESAHKNPSYGSEFWVAGIVLASFAKRLRNRIESAPNIVLDRTTKNEPH